MNLLINGHTSVVNAPFTVAFYLNTPVKSKQLYSLVPTQAGYAKQPCSTKAWSVVSKHRVVGSSRVDYRLFSGVIRV